MEDRKKIYDVYIGDFDTYKMINSLQDSNFMVTEETIVTSMKLTEERFKKTLGDVVLLSDKERQEIIKKIKARYFIYQEEGDVILGNYDQDYDRYKSWLESNESQTYFWDRYKNYLFKIKKLPSNVIETLEYDTLYKVMSYLGNPNDESHFSVRGLVVGDVQSGKTSNYIGLITKAADAGYKVIFVLTGTIESLRKQTQQRIEEGFIGYDSKNACDVGVGRGDKMPKSFTSRSKDFTGSDNLNTTYKLSNYSSEPMIFVLKKNVSVLQKVFSSLKNINTSPNHPKINYPALIIDDEADNASINTNKKEHDPTKINNLIRKLLSIFSRNSYVGFTATPFANVFISYDKEDEMLKDDLFPRDFIYALNSPSNYCGPKKYFVEKNQNVKFISDADESIFPLKHKKEWCGTKLFDSLYEAIRTFLIANTIRDITDTMINTHRSMLINMSRFKNVQSEIMNIVEEYVDEIKRAVKQTHKLPLARALTNNLVFSLKETFEAQYSSLTKENNLITWDNVFRHLYSSISKIKVIVVNSGKNSAKLNYDEAKEGLRVIAVGGLALSRGLTLEGLMTSYFYRNTSTFDVLLQMGRWFGYRDGYSDLCRIWLSETSFSYYKYIYNSIESLKHDIKTMGKEKRKPEDFGIRVRNDSIDLGITAANKMRGTYVKCIRKSFYGGLFETPYISRDLNLVEDNINKTLAFLSEINLEQRDNEIKPHPYFRNVKFSKVLDLIKSLNISNSGDTYFDKKQILNFIENNIANLQLCDVLLMGGKAKIDGKVNPYRFKFEPLNIDIPLVSRKFDVRDDDIRISRSRLRLGGSSDTQYGIPEDKMPITHSKAQDYLIEDRNPLFIIYFIRPSLPNELDEEDFTSDKETGQDLNDMYKLRRELSTRKYPFLIGIGLGFPRKTGIFSESTYYTVNKSVNYYDKDHDNESEEI